MKQCPICKNSYTDDSLRFCLADGANLFSIDSPAEVTEQFSGGTSPIRVNLAQETSPTVFSSAPPLNASPQKGKGLVIGLLFGMLLLAVIAVAGIIGWFLLKGGANEIKVADDRPKLNINSPPQPPPKDESENLKEKIANLEKQIQEEKKKKPNLPTINQPVNSNPTPSSGKVSAKVNSPNDGFLALRTEPNAETGERILQIPHGSTVTVMGCLPKAAGKKGRWCRVDYNGNAGWAFDGFLTY